MVCTLVKSTEQFLNDGCDNCEAFLKMREDNARVTQHTSHSFEGMTAIQNPSDSWVAKYQGISHLKPGVYALEVTGVIDPDIQDFLRGKNITWRAKPPS